MRERFIRPVEILSLSAMIFIVLVLLFPKRTLMEKVEGQGKQDALALDYLTNLLRIAPGDADLRLLLARSLARLGRWREAERVLAPLLQGGEAAGQGEARWLEYRIVQAETYTYPSGSPARHAGLERMRVLLRHLAMHPIAGLKLETLARESLALNDVATAISLYERSAKSKRDPALFVRAAELALGAGDYRHSARLYFAAQAVAGGLDQRRKCFLAGVRTLQSGKLLTEALIAADTHLGGLADDQQTLLALTRLALAAGQPQRAQIYVKRLLRLGSLDMGRSIA